MTNGKHHPTTSSTKPAPAAKSATQHVVESAGSAKPAAKAAEAK